MSIYGFPAGPRGPGATGGRFSLGSVATVVAAAILFLIIVISLFGDSDDGEPKQVIKIEGGGESGETVSLPVNGEAAPATAGELLMAANGVVISDPALLETSTDGPVPRIANDGRKPMLVYARPFDVNDPRPKIAVVVGGLGLGEAPTAAAVDRLPPGVSLAFTPYGSSLQSVVSAARSKGHEVLLEIPMEPFDYPSSDPGQNTLLTGVASSDNPAKLRWLLSRVAGYAGLINSQGGKYLSSQDDVRFVVDETKRRGLYMVDTGESEQSIAREVAETTNAPFARADKRIDNDPRREAIERELASLEQIAKQRGVAVGVASAIPVTIDRVSAWAAGLEQKGLALAPVTAVIAAAPTALPAVDAKPAPSPAPPPARTPTSSQPKHTPASTGGPVTAVSAPARAPQRTVHRPVRPRPAATQKLPTNPEPAFETAPHP